MATAKNNRRSVQRFFRTQAHCAWVCAPPLGLCAKESAYSVRFRRATSEPKRNALGFDALSGFCAAPNFLLVDFCRLPNFSAETSYPHRTKTGASRGYGGVVKGAPNQSALRHCFWEFVLWQLPMPLDRESVVFIFTSLTICTKSSFYGCIKKSRCGMCFLFI